jgi:hypothetical protein
MNHVLLLLLLVLFLVLGKSSPPFPCIVETM